MCSITIVWCVYSQFRSLMAYGVGVVMVCNRYSTNMVNYYINTTHTDHISLSLWLCWLPLITMSTLRLMGVVTTEHVLVAMTTHDQGLMEHWQFLVIVYSLQMPTGNVWQFGFSQNGEIKWENGQWLLLKVVFNTCLIVCVCVCVCCCCALLYISDNTLWWIS